MDEYARKDEIKLDNSVPQGFVARMKEALDDSGPPTEKLEKGFFLFISFSSS